MPSWPRDILPRESSPFLMPGALASKSQSGKSQRRSTVQIGRVWTETYPPFLAGSANGRKLIATINDFWRNGTTFDIQHRLYLTHNGSGTGTPLVNQIGMTGTSLITNNWTGSNPVLKAGDIIKIAGITHVFDVTADASHTTGDATLSLNPPVFAGGSPADNAEITYTGVTLSALIDSQPDIPSAGPDTFIAGLTITFCESV